MEGIEKLKVKPIFQIFYNEDNSFGIYACKDLSNKDSFGFYDDELTILGTMPSLKLYEEYTVYCIPRVHERYGLQYKVISFTSLKNMTMEDEQKFLKLLVTDLQFANIVDKYPKPVSAFLSGEFDYEQVYGIGEKTYNSIRNRIEDNFCFFDAFVKLSDYDISLNQIKNIIRHYDSSTKAIKQIKENPYVLCREVAGIGFKTADRIALSQGIAEDDIRRIEMGAIYCLDQNEDQGSTYMTLGNLIKEIVDLLQISYDTITTSLEKILVNEEDFFYDGNRVALRKTFECEKEIAELLMQLEESSVSKLYESKQELEEDILAIENHINIRYTDEQKELFYKLNTNNVILLTGYAGTGKTLLLNGSLKLLRKKNLKYVLMSPTAKAAKVMEQYTGEEASTIHRGLNQDKIYKADVVIVDEASMMDIYLFRRLLRAIPEGSRLLLIGDPAQLESVATGNVLYDLITSEIFATVKLQTVFRQALDSGILQAATNVRLGKRFYDSSEVFFECGVDKDFRIWFSDKENTLERLEVLFMECLSRYSYEDIMVISPIKKSTTGVEVVNSQLQQMCNPPSPQKNELKVGDIVFREGDKVMHVKNNYDALWWDEDFQIKEGQGVFNGDVGKIIKIDANSLTVFVDYGEKIIKYFGDELYTDLELAYAMTCHKSQGSSSPVVIMLLNTSHYMNLKRNLLYTGITRASQEMYLIADKKALNIALNNNSLLHKNTFLQGLVVECARLDK